MRLQLDLPESKVTELKALMQETGAQSYRDFFNNALTLTKWAIREVEDGRIIASLDERSGQYKELVMPILAVAGQRAGLRDPRQEEVSTDTTVLPNPM